MKNLKFIWIHESIQEMIVSMLRCGKNDKDVVSAPSFDKNLIDL